VIGAIALIVVTCSLGAVCARIFTPRGFATIAVATGLGGCALHFVERQFFDLDVLFAFCVLQVAYAIASFRRFGVSN
jgi:hypothetical protein